MKRGAEQQFSFREKKVKIEQIYGEVPNDIWQVIFAHLPPSFWGVVRQVSTEWHTLVQNLSEQSIHRYFSYLVNHPDYQTQSLSLSLFVQEYQRYQRYQQYFDIPMDVILSVLEGKIEGILSEANPDFQKILYGLRFAKGYPLPEKGLSEENILEIKGWAILFAAWQGNTPLLEELLILQGIDEKYKDMAFGFAVENGYVEVVAKLAELGVKVNTRNQNGATPIHIAAENGHAGMIAKLVELGVNVNARGYGGPMPTYIAAPNADVNIRSYNGVMPIHIAAENGHIGAIIELAAVLGADVNAQDYYTVTPVHAAANKGQIEAIALLVALGANVNAQDYYGATPTFIAAQKGQIEAIAQLAALNADVNIPTKHGETPLFVAAHKGNVDAIIQLVAVGADVDRSSHNGATPILVAAESGHVDVVAKLVELGANVNINNKGITPIFIAATRGHAKVVQFLLNVNVNIQPCISSVEFFSNFARFHGDVVIDRMDRYIQEKIQNGYNIEKIPLLPSEMAYIMGHDEIVNIFKASNDTKGSPAITFVFDTQKDSSSSSSEENTMEIDENNHEQSFFSNYCRLM